MGNESLRIQALGIKEEARKAVGAGGSSNKGLSELINIWRKFWSSRNILYPCLECSVSWFVCVQINWNAKLKRNQIQARINSRKHALPPFVYLSFYSQKMFQQMNLSIHYWSGASAFPATLITKTHQQITRSWMKHFSPHPEPAKAKHVGEKGYERPTPICISTQELVQRKFPIAISSRNICWHQAST